MSDHDLDHLDHVVDELPALLGGELNRRTTGIVTAHLRDCDDCRHALVDLAAASAALHSAVRFAPEVGGGGSLPDPAGLLTAITGSASREAGSEPEFAREPGRESAPWPVDLSPPGDSTSDTAAADPPADLLADPSRPADPSLRVPSTASSPSDLSSGRPGSAGGHRPEVRSGRRGRRLRPRLVLSAAAAVVVLAVGVTIFVSSRDSGQATRELALRPVDSTAAAGTATLRGDRLRIQADGLPNLDGGRFYQVWLVQGSDRLFAVGLLPPDGKATYQLTKPILDDYSRIEISVEPDDGDPGYSGRSVLRATYS